MNRDDNSKYLLYIEPSKKEKLLVPINDELTELIKMAITTNYQEGTAGYSDLDDEGTFEAGYGYKGWHTTDCGEKSDNKDILLENGMITNSLAPFYLQWYRNSIPETDIQKLLELKQFYDDRE